MAGFTETKGDRLRCALCHREYGHTATCPVLALSEHVNDLASHLGIFLANMRESLDAIIELLKDERESEP
jgi:hypothetical protein